MTIYTRRTDPLTEREIKAVYIQMMIGRKLQDRINSQNAAIEKAKQKQEEARK